MGYIDDLKSIILRKELEIQELIHKNEELDEQIEILKEKIEQLENEPEEDWEEF